MLFLTGFEAPARKKGLILKISHLIHITMKISKYLAKVKHDNGTMKLTVMATSKGAAKIIIGKAEGCPDRAIQSITRIPKYTWTYVIQGNYGFGWEDLTQDVSYKAAKQHEIDYIYNDIAPIRMIKRRELNPKY